MLPLKRAHIELVTVLPEHHHDPFDRRSSRKESRKG
jgi:PIN domain nuclease of toxin-antitoxin system